jgi:hypothetical protein
MIRISSVAPLGVLMAAVACTNPAGNSEAPGMQAARAPAGPSVQATIPSYGNRGEQGKVVRIKGSGFDNGSTARWELNGIPDHGVTVVSTQFISSTELDATINIENDATLAFYDVAVTTLRGRKGIGTEVWELTQAIAVPGTSILRGVNDNGNLGGSLYGNGGTPGGARFFSLSTGLVVLPEILPDGGAVTSIDEAGVTMSGAEGGAVGVTPVWSLVGGVWQHAVLPDDPTAVGGHGWAIASDPGTGLAIYIAGHENFKGKGNSTIYKPRLWKRVGSSWERVVLPSLTSDGRGVVQDITPAGVAVGNSNGRAVTWEPNGTGGWSIAYLPGTEFDAKGINSAGTLIGGGSRAYWTRSGSGPWTLSFLPLACRAVMAVDDQGRIGADNCERPGTITRPAVFVPPYSTNPVFLGSLGSKGTAANLEKMSLNGSWIAGQIGGGGVYWKPF